MAGPLVGQHGVEWTAPLNYEEKFVTFVWDDRGQRTGVCEMPWRDGWTVKLYLREQPLRAYPLLAMWKRCRTVNRNRQKVKLNYIPPAGDAIVISGR